LVTAYEVYDPDVSLGSGKVGFVVLNYYFRADNIEIVPDNGSPTAIIGMVFEVSEGDSVTLNGSGSDPDNDPITFAWDLDNNGHFETRGQNPAFSAAGRDGPDTQIVVLQVCDDKGACDATITTVSIQNVAPNVDAITAPVDPLPVNSEIAVTAAFTDPGVPDTHEALWDWGDGTTSVGTVSETNGSGSVSGARTYDAAGVYTLTLTVTDDDGDSGQSVYRYVVVYDPSEGFVTGGGFINSPLGAYAPDPSLAGEANFGFVSKYKKGATTPSGQTNFQFQVADLHFHSEVYEWLVIAGARAKFKGTGTINGDGNYGFMLSGVDENLTTSTDVDLFRIKIWDKDNADAVVYDNQMEDLDDADLTTAIAGGNIKIHTTGGGPGAASERALPSAFALLQNHPNPFNPTTTIRYDVPRGGGHVMLRVYNVSGQLVRTLVNGFESAGHKNARWNATDDRGQTVSTGIYFYQLKAEGFSETRKMLLMK
jgi:PKD repeat protein